MATEKTNSVQPESGLTQSNGPRNRDLLNQINSDQRGMATWLAWCLTASGVLIVIGYLALYWVVPVMALNHIQQWYQQQGDGYQLDIGSWGFQPHLGRLQLTDVWFRFPDSSKQETPRNGFTKFEVNLDISALFQQRIMVEKAVISGSQLSIEGATHQSDGRQYRIAGIPIRQPSPTFLSTDDFTSLTFSVKERAQQWLQQYLPPGWQLAWQSFEFKDHQQALTVLAPKENADTQAGSVQMRVFVQDLTAGAFDLATDSRFPFAISFRINELAGDTTQTNDLNIESFQLIKPIQVDIEAAVINLDRHPTVQIQAGIGDMAVEIRQTDRADSAFIESKGLQLLAGKLEWQTPLISLQSESFVLKESSIQELVIQGRDVKRRDLQRQESPGSVTKGSDTQGSGTLSASIASWKWQDSKISFKPSREWWDLQLQGNVSDMKLAELLLLGDEGQRLQFDALSIETGTVRSIDGEPVVALTNLVIDEFEYADRKDRFDTDDASNQSTIDDTNVEDTVPFLTIGRYQLADSRINRQRIALGLQRLTGMEAVVERNALRQWSLSSQQRLLDFKIDSTVLSPPLVRFLPAEIDNKADADPSFDLSQITVKQFDQDSAQLTREIQRSIDQGKGFLGTSSSAARDKQASRDRSGDVSKSMFSSGTFDTDGRQSYAFTDSAIAINQWLESLPISISMAGTIIQSSTQHPVRLKVLDRAVMPTLVEQLLVEKLSISEIDSRRYQLPISMQAQFSIGGQDSRGNNRNSLELTSRLTSNDIEFNYRLKGEEISAAVINPYLISISGYRLNQGQIAYDSSGVIKLGYVTSQTALTLGNSELMVADRLHAATLNEQLSMPLETALGVLQDKDGLIKLQIPVNNNLKDANVSTVIQQQAGKAIKASALDFLKTNIKPMGTTFEVEAYVGQERFALRLENIPFQSKSAILQSSSKAVLTRIATMLKDKPDLQLKVCGMVSKDEVTELAGQWSILAENRALAVRQFFGNQEDKKGYQISDRIALCQAQQGPYPEVVVGF